MRTVSIKDLSLYALGSDTLLELVQNKKGAKSKTQNLSPDNMKSHSEKQAQEIIIIGTKILELNLTEKGVELRKGDPRKVAIACVIKKRTHLTNQWIATKLDMGHDRSVSRLIRKAQTETPIKKMLQCEDCPLLPSTTGYCAGRGIAPSLIE